MQNSVTSANSAIITKNPVTSHVHYTTDPKFYSDVFVGPGSAVVGDVTIKGPVFIGFHNIIRADYGSPFFIGPGTSIHDHCLIHGQPNQFVKVGAYRWSVHIDGEVSILHGSAVHGPCRVGKNTFIGQHVSIFDAEIGPNCVIMHGANITGGVKIPEGRYVEPGKTVFKQEDADGLPPVPGDHLSVNPETVNGYMELLYTYNRQTDLNQLKSL
ncbi:LbetaH domain-containing protein [Haloplasma contractile]|uniref:Carbon dioxide concentrating mechanism protein n=1 Tax=Haloplasma contractile SSD-17B TaxID=1033810 RepID=U2DQX7_9MOLU|nr:carbonic anhydrase [Haloplasma contractile]ERJ10992.1 Carbon dioxide concentrating mechanism protein [Haloplasma contractile SSD-17B]